MSALDARCCRGRRCLRRLGMLSHRAPQCQGEHALSIESRRCCWSAWMPSAAPMRQKSTSEVPGRSCRALPADQSSKSAKICHGDDEAPRRWHRVGLDSGLPVGPGTLGKATGSVLCRSDAPRRRPAQPTPKSRVVPLPGSFAHLRSVRNCPRRREPRRQPSAHLVRATP